MAQRVHHGMNVEKGISGHIIILERVLHEIVSKPITTMFQKLQDMSENSLDHLRECLPDLIGNNKESKKPSTFQEIV